MFGFVHARCESRLGFIVEVDGVRVQSYRLQPNTLYEIEREDKLNLRVLIVHFWIEK